MALKQKMKNGNCFRPRFRIHCGDDIAIGPGKAELLEKVQEAGSIAEAAKQMGMSYMRAWTLIRTMQRCFKKPLLKVVRGGPKGGGAELTDTGRSILELYHRLEEQCLEATQDTWDRIKELLRD
jgi:molybdate transport system regulatory protein